MKKYIKIGFILMVISLGFISTNAFAATVYLESSNSNISVGDTVIVSVKINAEGITINTVEGDIALSSGSNNNLTVKEFSLANSSFGLWPRTPSLSKDGSVISFVGGVPGGFNIEGATLFKIIFEAKKEGSVTITPKNIVVFASDGKGTKLSVQTKSLVIKVGPKKAGTNPSDEWQSIVAQDNIPPEDFIIVLGQDNSLFDGKKFVFFSAKDNQSGVSYYEVSENDAPAVRSGSTYVLQNQNGDVKLKVTAFDKAGNKKIATYPSSRPISWARIIIAVFLIIILRIIYKKWRKSKKNVSLYS